MIESIDRGHIRVRMGGKTAVLQGEMFFPGNSKMGFVLYVDLIDYWEPKDGQDPISDADKELIIRSLQEEFSKNGHVLELDNG